MKLFILILFYYILNVFCCLFNYECGFEYFDQDKCFMEATYQDFGDSVNEGFCNDGECVKKRSLGEDCINSGGISSILFF